MNKTYITPQELMEDSYRLGAQVVKSGFKPEFMVAFWRGGAPIGCYIHELLKWKDINTDHIAIRTSKYTGIGISGTKVMVHNLSYLVEKVKIGSSILVVDDVWDSGASILAFFEKLTKETMIPFDKLDIRVATIHYKPKKNKTLLKPNYYIKETDEWLVYPHEVEDMDLNEIEHSKGKTVSDIFKSL
jgi:uncharacterized protein